MRRRSARTTCTSLPCGHSSPHSSVNPPTWLDERGQPRAKCPCPNCGREIPVLSIRTELLKWYGWQPWQLWSTVEWCGHRVEGIPVPDTDGRWRLIMVEGEAN